jgi:hypothetical protein
MHSRCLGLKGDESSNFCSHNQFIFKYLNKYVRGNCLKQFYLVLYDLIDYTYKNKQSTIQEPNQIFQNQTLEN